MLDTSSVEKQETKGTKGQGGKTSSAFLLSGGTGSPFSFAWAGSVACSRASGILPGSVCFVLVRMKVCLAHNRLDAPSESPQTA